MLIVFHATAALCALVCLALPLRALLQPGKGGKNFDTFSFLFCAAAAIMEVLAMQCLIRVEDWQTLSASITWISYGCVGLFALMALLTSMAYRKTPKQ